MAAPLVLWKEGSQSVAILAQQERKGLAMQLAEKTPGDGRCPGSSDQRLEARRNYKDVSTLCCAVLSARGGPGERPRASNTEGCKAAGEGPRASNTEGYKAAGGQRQGGMPEFQGSMRLRYGVVKERGMRETRVPQSEGYERDLVRDLVREKR
ncbi:hypothetical protein Bbelb_283820 [Branchiostoma belcheri]|nr:hypothetical protein Bbelb_283820 [Branchiostoma belcheri]